MRKWGIVVTAFYGLVVVALFLPSVFWIAGSGGDSLRDAARVYRGWQPWVLVAAFLGGEALLLLLAVDTSQRRLRPRASLLLSVGVGALLLALLTLAVAAALSAMAWGDHMDRWGPWGSWPGVLGLWGALWIAWGAAFHRVYRGRGLPVDRIVWWLLRGSVLELLVAIPCHVWVRRRGDCSAPLATGLGIATGVAIMLLSFGPGVLFLVKRRLDGYRR